MFSVPRGFCVLPGSNNIRRARVPSGVFLPRGHRRRVRGRRTPPQRRPQLQIFMSTRIQLQKRNKAKGQFCGLHYLGTEITSPRQS